ncbi:helix-turn-helix transcriptional regulator [bacterium]|nr:helix-turn-helix transcriptional regulator [bacterium]
MDIKLLFGKKVKEYRIKLSMTQEELAEKIGISAKSLSQIELGNNFVSAETLNAICNALNTNPKNMFDFYDNSQENSFEYIKNKLSNNKYLSEKIIKIIDIIE